MQLDPAVRADLAARIIDRLAVVVPGAQAQLRGSLADQWSDPYSDIDVLWEVPDDQFAFCAASTRDILADVHPVASFRSDPEWQAADRYRLFFIRFAALPLFWRLDLELYARSLQRDRTRSARRPDEQDALAWSWTESALANGVAAVKASLRHDDAQARELLDRAYRRVGVPMPPGEVPEAIVRLATEVERMDPRIADVARHLIRLVAGHLR